MSDPPKAQRLQRLFNEDDFDAIESEKQCQNLVDIIQEEARQICKTIKDNVPFKIELR